MRTGIRARDGREWSRAIPTRVTVATQSHGRDGALLRISLSLLVCVPLVFSTAVHRIFALPRFAVLLTGSSLLIGFLVIAWLPVLRKCDRFVPTKYPISALLVLYTLCVFVSSVFGVAPAASLSGSFEDQMGCLTYLCFLIVSLGIVKGVGNSKQRLECALWSMVITGLLVAGYGLAQFLGFDPFLDPGTYTYASASGRLMRVVSTIGHADYLGNFLLYTAPLSAGLGIARRGRSRWIALVGFTISLIVMIATGTRGAWLGLTASAIVFVFLERRPACELLCRTVRVRLIPAGLLAALVLAIGSGIVKGSSSYQHIAARARAVVSDGLSGSGRTLLWRDALSMVPAYPLLGCGAEGFRRAFLPWKSLDLARLAPQTNNESSHNSYIDAAVSFGFPGLVLYLAIIASTLYLLIRSRCIPMAGSDRIVLTGLLASVSGVAVHNIFIFDQISTGLYFFALAALAQCVRIINGGEGAGSFHKAPNASAQAAKRKQRIQDRRADMRSPVPGRSHLFQRLAVGCGFCLICFSCWYSASLLNADIELKNAFVAANAGDLDSLVSSGNSAARCPEPTGAYRFHYAGALTIYLERLQPAGSPDIAARREKVISLASEMASDSIKFALAPDSNYLLLAYLALLRGDAASLRESAIRATSLNPNYSDAHSLLGEACLAAREFDEAAREGEIALGLNASSTAAASVLARAKGKGQLIEPSMEEFLSNVIEMIHRGRIGKARHALRSELQRSNGQCSECRGLLAEVEEVKDDHQSDR